MKIMDKKLYLETYGCQMNVSDSEVVVSILEKEGYKVRNALDGKTALLSISVKQPDIILLDINMPKMNGFEVCRKLKADPKTAHIPVVFLING